MPPHTSTRDTATCATSRVTVPPARDDADPVSLALYSSPRTLRRCALCSAPCAAVRAGLHLCDCRRCGPCAAARSALPSAPLCAQLCTLRRFTRWQPSAPLRALLCPLHRSKRCPPTLHARLALCAIARAARPSRPLRFCTHFPTPCARCQPSALYARLCPLRRCARCPPSVPLAHRPTPCAGCARCPPFAPLRALLCPQSARAALTLRRFTRIFPSAMLRALLCTLRSSPPYAPLHARLCPLLPFARLCARCSAPCASPRPPALCGAALAVLHCALFASASPSAPSLHCTQNKTNTVLSASPPAPLPPAVLCLLLCLLRRCVVLLPAPRRSGACSSPPFIFSRACLVQSPSNVWCCCASNLRIFGVCCAAIFPIHPPAIQCLFFCNFHPLIHCAYLCSTLLRLAADLFTMSSNSSRCTSMCFISAFCCASLIPRI